MTPPEVLITAPRLATAAGESPIAAPGYVVAAGGAIMAVGQGDPPRTPDIALPNGVLLPGFVDLQVNRYFGEEFRTADADSWARVTTRLPQTGTTSLPPTFITAPPGVLTAGLRAAAALIPALPAGARVLGVHVEGPFTSPAWKGAHNEAWIAEPSAGAVAELLDAGRGVLRLVTLARTQRRHGGHHRAGRCGRPGQRRPQRRDRAAGRRGRRPRRPWIGGELVYTQKGVPG